MTTWENCFVQDESQLFGRTLGEALAKMVRKRWPRDTAKKVAQAWDLDPSTAANVCRGHCSERTLTKAIRAEGWSILAPLGEAMTGRSYEQHLQHLIEETDRARAQIEARRQRVRGLQRQAAGLDDLPARLDPVPPG